MSAQWSHIVSCITHQIWETSILSVSGHSEDAEILRSGIGVPMDRVLGERLFEGMYVPLLGPQPGHKPFSVGGRLKNVGP